ncbi:MAG: IlvD/Edd family dehydratase, partial [Gammaproteobacteria bacterium]
GITREELQSGKPIVGIAQSGSDLSPCNRIHLQTAKRARDGIIAAGGVPMEFPTHPIQETGRRPTAALDRNLAYLGLVEVLHGYPLDGVILTTGCDKTTPASIMAAATADIPAIVLSGGPMLNGWHENKRAGSGAVIWNSRLRYAAGEITREEFMDTAANSAPSPGHCNTMGTALTMNCLAEGLGMSLPGCAAIPAPHRARLQMAYNTGGRIVEMIKEDLRPSRILTRAAFDNAISLATAIGASTNAPIHINAIARHLGITLNVKEWSNIGLDLPLLVNCQPAGEFLGEDFYRAGGVPAVMGELLRAGKLHRRAVCASGRTIAAQYAKAVIKDNAVIRAFDKPLKKRAGFLALSGNLFDDAIMKTSVISDSFRRAHLQKAGQKNILQGAAVVFDGAEDYRARINNPKLNINESSILIMRGAGVLAWPGSAEVVNMQPPDKLIKRGITELPCIGDGRQSGTSAAPAILNASPEAAAGGGLALIKDGDIVRVDLNKGTANILISDDELCRRRKQWQPPKLQSQTPWQELYREKTGQLSGGGCLEFALKYRAVARKTPRHNH